jgi:Protein of unknown function (DUF1361).
MVWNTLLAMVPLALPNAPYVLTDLIHLIDDARDGVLIRTVLLYSGFIAVGVGAYTVSVARFIAFLRRAGLGVRTTVAGTLRLAAVGAKSAWNSMAIP